jgi:hypothetical protein
LALTSNKDWGAEISATNTHDGVIETYPGHGDNGAWDDNAYLDVVVEGQPGVNWNWMAELDIIGVVKAVAPPPPDDTDVVTDSTGT